MKTCLNINNFLFIIGVRENKKGFDKYGDTDIT